MSVVYAVDSSGTGNIDTYMLPAAVTQWGNVKAARITLTFINPYAAQQPGIPTINWVQTINLMNNK
jgi:type IV pilus assembly protein PilW